MRTWIVFGISAALVAISNSVSAQYNDLRSPQTSADIHRMYSMHVKSVTQFLEVNGSSAPVGISYLDTGGRLLRIASREHRAYYTYDKQGRLTASIDSVSDGRRFEKKEYSFQYDETGRPKHFRIDRQACEFNYDAEGHKMSETIVTGAQSASKIYMLNDQGKIVSERMSSPSGEGYWHKFMYNKYGDLASEIKVSHNNNGTLDSMVSIYTYDGKGRLIRKHIASRLGFTLKHDSLGRTSISGGETLQQNYAYIFDMQGNMTSEVLTSSKAAESYKIEYQYDPTGLLTRQIKYDVQNKEISRYAYKYKQ